jgi:hypothetical protein
VNADTTKGAVWCEVLDEHGFRMPGFEKDACTPLKKKDTTRYRFAWRDKKLSDLPKGSYLIRLHLQSAAVYAVSLR